MNVMLMESFVRERNNRNIGIAIGGPLAGKEINSASDEYIRVTEHPFTADADSPTKGTVSITGSRDRYNYFENFFRLRDFRISAWVHESLMADNDYMSDRVVTHLIEAYKKQSQGDTK